MDRAFYVSESEGQGDVRADHTIFSADARSASHCVENDKALEAEYDNVSDVEIETQSRKGSIEARKAHEAKEEKLENELASVKTKLKHLEAYLASEF
ncbi:hypothetical protein CSOJ01_09894 [Colletotrichum sojae]|uniref:Uncharacterized protein n=1 Tax=Colletotrichum sojae TaxID=2175907 RepID=A0A8H6J1R5_9PEZI|nr:hypothetical protein CSOJ01_09894 [Colletotrichum sojae]